MFRLPFKVYRAVIFLKNPVYSLIIQLLSLKTTDIINKTARIKAEP